MSALQERLKPLLTMLDLASELACRVFGPDLDPSFSAQPPQIAMLHFDREMKDPAFVFRQENVLSVTRLTDPPGIDFGRDAILFRETAPRVLTSVVTKLNLHEVELQGYEPRVMSLEQKDTWLIFALFLHAKNLGEHCADEPLFPNRESSFLESLAIEFLLVIQDAASGHATIPRAASPIRVRGAIRFLPVFREIQSIASQTYEGAGATGELWFVGEQAQVENLTVVLLDRAFSLETKRMRKLVHGASEAAPLVLEGTAGRAVGYGKPDSCRARVEFTGKSNWLLHSSSGKPLLQVSEGKPQLPTVFDQERVEHLIAGLCEGAKVPELVSLLRGASNSKHGMVLVISDNAKEEAKRLGRTAHRIQPARLTPESIAQLGAVDGAVLLDFQGLTHAFGVILDGVAYPSVGDKSRGARYNSSLRYKVTREKLGEKVLVAIVSDDGGITYQ